MPTSPLSPEDQFGIDLIQAMEYHRHTTGDYPTNEGIAPALQRLTEALPPELQAVVESEQSYIYEKLDALRNREYGIFPDDMAFAIAQILRGYHKD